MCNSVETGKKSSTWTKAEAISIIAQCALLRDSIDKLEKRAAAVLKKPNLRVVE